MGQLISLVRDLLDLRAKCMDCGGPVTGYWNRYYHRCHECKRKLRRRLYERQKGRCPLPYCSHGLIQMATSNIDHRFPRGSFGSNKEGNLQLVHAYCNKRKGNRW